MISLRKTCKPIKQNESGFILNVTIWISSLLLLSSLLISLSARTNTVALVNNYDLLKGQEIAVAGLNIALSMSSDEEFLQQIISRSRPVTVEVNGATIDITIEDERSKVDVNRLPFEIVSRLFVAVARETGVSDFVALDIARRLSRQSQGAENDTGPRLSSIGDLQFFPGVTVEYYKALEKHITVHGFSQNINPNTASEFVLRQIPGMTNANLRNLISARRNNRTRPNLGEAELWLSTLAGPVYTFRIKATLPNNVSSALTALVLVNQDEIGITENGLVVIEIY